MKFQLLLNMLFDLLQEGRLTARFFCKNRIVQNTQKQKQNLSKIKFLNRKKDKETTKRDFLQIAFFARVW